MKRTALLRRTPLRRSPMSRGRRSRYASRPRDFDWIGVVIQLPCAVLVDPPDPNRITRCSGRIEADHQGNRALSRKAEDDTCVPMCSQHHRERTDHSGCFRRLKQADVRVWRERAIERTRASVEKLVGSGSAPGRIDPANECEPGGSRRRPDPCGAAVSCAANPEVGTFPPLF